MKGRLKLQKKSWLIFSFILVFILILNGCSGNNNSDSEYVIQIGTENPEDHPMTKATMKFKDIVEEKSDGRIEVEAYPNNQLGNQTEQNEATRDGRIQATYSGMSFIGGNFEPKYNVFSLPFIITRENLDDAFELLDGEVGEELTSSLEESGMTTLGYANLGFRNITNSKHKISDPEDLEGIKIRLQSNPVHIDTFETLGAETATIDFAEVYSGLQQGVIDAQENPLDIIYTNNLYEVQDYLTVSGHFFDFAGIWFNKEYFDDLPEDLQGVLLESGQEAVEYHRETYLKEEDEYLNKLEDEGMEINELTEDEIQKFQEAVEPVYQDFLNDAEDKELSEKILSELDVDY